MFRNPREIAVRFLCDPPELGFTESNLSQVLNQSPLDSRDRSLAQELVYGIIRQREVLEWLLSKLTAGRPQKEPVSTLLKLGLYQLFWLDRIPAHAAINETVALAKKCGAASASGFINAILRRSQRESDILRSELEGLKASRPWLACSHPKWLWERWSDHWGEKSARALMDWNNTPAQTFARVNLLKGTGEELLALWKGEGVECEAVETKSGVSVFKLTKHPAISELKSFIGGCFYIQDPSTLHAVDALDPQPGERILDACAAPGGKAMYIAQRMQNDGVVVAHDPSEKRLERVRENSQRMGTTSVSSTSDFHSLESESFDRILADVPCSNTGVMRRRVDLRWRIKPDEISRLAEKQLEILQSLAPLLKPSGALVYSTCSIEGEENAQLIKRFLELNPAFVLKEQSASLPFRDLTDGAYFARLEKASS